MFEKICIYGAGAIGGWLVADLLAAGKTVSVVAHGEILRVLQTRGLCMRWNGAQAGE